MMKILTTLILLVPLFSLAQLEVSMPALVEVTQKSEYSLYDLAVLKEGTSEDLDNFKKITIADLSKKGVLEAIREANSKIKIIFEEVFKIATTTQVNKKELQRKITNHLTSQCNACIYDIQISKLPFTNSATMNFRTAEFDLARGSFMLPLVDSATTVTNKFYATGSWKTFKKVSVANKWMGQGYRVTSEDLKEELKEVTFLNDKLVERENLIGKQVVRAIAANTIITRDLLVVEKMIKKGDLIRLILKDGPFEIEMNAQAEADGLEGDSIKVKANQKVITAKVVSKDKVVSE